MHDPEPDASYTTLSGAAEAELRVQRSRFLAHAAPAADAEAARALIDAMARRHHDARHVCWGCRLGVGVALVEQRSDAGEPSGTAGEPILGALRRRGVTDAVVVVARWFGGVKLGTGGLGRAYRDAAAAALEAAPLRTVARGRRFVLRLPYELVRPLEHLLSRCGGRVEDARFGADVAWTVWLPLRDADAFAREVDQLSHGRVAAAPAD